MMQDPSHHGEGHHQIEEDERIVETRYLDPVLSIVLIGLSFHMARDVVVDRQQQKGYDEEYQCDVDYTDHLNQIVTLVSDNILNPHTCGQCHHDDEIHDHSISIPLCSILAKKHTRPQV